MNRRGILNVSATIALGLALFGITAESVARAAEIRLLSAVALHPAIDALIPDFEKSSGHKITVAYGNAGAIADRFQKGEAADLVINAAPLMDQLRARQSPGRRRHHHREGRCQCLCAQGCREARHQFSRRLQTFDVGLKLDYLSGSGRWGCQWHLHGQLARTIGHRCGNEAQDQAFSVCASAVRKRCERRR